MRVRLLRKFADRINGVDLRGVDVGDVMIVMPREAALLIAEGWAEPAPVVHGSLLTLRQTNTRQSSAD